MPGCQRAQWSRSAWTCPGASVQTRAFPPPCPSASNRATAVARQPPTRSRSVHAAPSVKNSRMSKQMMLGAGASAKINWKEEAEWGAREFHPRDVQSNAIVLQQRRRPPQRLGRTFATPMTLLGTKYLYLHELAARNGRAVRQRIRPTHSLRTASGPLRRATGVSQGGIQTDARV